MKLKSLVLAFFMIFIVSSARADTSPEINILLRPENFTLPEVLGTWSIQPSAMIYAGGIPGTFLRNSNASDSPATARIYIPEDGTYAYWGLSADASGAEASRHAKIGIDGVYDANEFGSDIPGFEWTRSANVFLSKGWHTVYVKTGYPTMSLTAVFVTNNLELVLSRDTKYEDISMFEDAICPEFSGNLESEYISNTSCNISFPTANDANGIMDYKCFVNGNEVSPVDGIYVAENLLPLEELKAEVIAFDSYGNKALKDKNIINSPFEVKSFDIKLENKVAKADISFLNRTNESKDVIMAIAVYTKNYDRMVYSNISNAAVLGKLDGTLTSSVTLSNEVCDNINNYVVYAMFWDNTTNAEAFYKGVTLEVNTNE